MTTDHGAHEESQRREQSAAATAAGQTRRVAGTAAGEAAHVAGTAKMRMRTVIGDGTQQVRSQVARQALDGRDRLSETLHTFGADLDQMIHGESPTPGLAADLVRQASQRARAIAHDLEARSPAQLLDAARDVARRRPGTFLLGALAAGVITGRLLRATADGAAAASLDGASATGRAAQARTSVAGSTTPTGFSATTSTAKYLTDEPDLRYAAPTPSLDAHTGIGYGTGADGTGGLDETPEPAESDRHS